MQQNRSRVVWIVAIAVAFFFFIDPFSLFTGRRTPTVRVDRETQMEQAAFAAASPSATDMVVDLLRSADVVLIGETGYAAQHVLFAAELIEALDSGGIHHLGYQYANSEDQDLLDNLVTASTFDESLARAILFNHLTVFGFQEHMDVFRAAWEVNRRKGSSDEPFRIIALSNRLNYAALTSEDQVEDREVMRQVFETGVPDQEMARVIATEFLDRNIKAAVYLQAEHAYTGFDRPEYGEEMEKLGYYGIRRTGNALRDSYGDRVVTAILHGPVTYTAARTGMAYPTGGVIERIADDLEEGRTIGFMTADSPFAETSIVSDALTQSGQIDLTVAGYTDAYLVVCPVKDLTAITPIPDFITEDNLETAIRDFPGVSPQDASVEDMNEFIAGNTERMSRVFDEFK